MSKFHRLSVAAMCFVALALLVSATTPKALADSAGSGGSGDGTVTKTKKHKAQKSGDKKSGDKSKATSKAKPKENYDEFDDDAKADDSESKSVTKTAVKAAEKALAATTTKAAEKASRNAVVRFVLSGEYPEAASDESLFGEMQPTLSKLMDRLNEAKVDKEVKAVWLRIEDVELGRGKVNELRSAIAAVRKAGKPVYAELVSADTGPYLVAAACDCVCMPSSGDLALPGVRLEMTFYKGLLDKLGLKFDMLHMGKFKGAAEPMTRETMSAPLRESLQAIVDDVYDGMVETIAKDRHLPDYTVKSLIDQGLFSAAEAKDAGLIDEVLYADEFEKSLSERLKVGKVEIETAYKKKQMEDFSGLGGFVKLMEAFSGEKKSERSSNKQKIAIVYAVGEITEGKSSSSFMGGSTLGSTTMVEAINKAFAEPKVVAVVLRVDSPGGSATASDLIWHATVAGKKPLVASMGNVAGSGGYYITMGAKKVFAEPETLTGSIGVLGGKLVTGGLYGKIGVNTEIVSRGKNSGIFTSNNPFTPDERRVWQRHMEQTYHEFVSKAAAGRHMDYEKLEVLAQGRVYTGRQAKKLGLVDQIGTLADAVAEAKKMAGLKATADVDLFVLPQPKSMFEQLFGGEGQEMDEFTRAVPSFFKTFRNVEGWKQLLSSKVMLWMPYHVELK
jgi:protease-4